MSLQKNLNNKITISNLVDLCYVGPVLIPDHKQLEGPKFERPSKRGPK